MKGWMRRVDGTASDRSCGMRRGRVAQAARTLCLAAMPLASFAQGEATLAPIEITGSSLRRIDAESASPVQVITRRDIERSGATSVVDLLRKMPAMQASVMETASLGGQTYGFSSVSIHGFGDVRTLVLLNGHRVASFGGQTLNGFAAAFDINALPIGAIERIEILTDGASAVYGADAVAGVVNVITRRDSAEGEVSIGYSGPAGGAKEKRVNVSKGFGSLADDGFNVMLSAASEHRSELNASSRSYARSGQIDFTGQDGRRYRALQSSSFGTPANVYDSDFYLGNLYLSENGVCPSNHFPVSNDLGDYCAYDYASQVQIYPERRRDSFMGSWTARPDSRIELFADLMLSRTRQTTRTAPALSQLAIEPGTPFHDAYLAPLGATDTVYANDRLSDLGRRVSEDTADFGDLALGARGELGAWNYHANYAHSESHVKSNIAGHVGSAAVNARVNSGELNPFVPVGQQTAAGLAALQSLNYRGYWEGGVTKLDTVAVRASRELADLPGGPLVLGAGASLNWERQQFRPSGFSQGLLADPVSGAPASGGASGDLRSDVSLPSVPYATSRDSQALYAEVLLPVATGFELGAALRHDRYSDFGIARTAKGSFRWTPVREWLVRGSVGNGFRAPSVPQTTAPQQSYGRTESYYDCTPALQAQAARLGAACGVGASQYNVVAGGNGDLKPERSLQANLGLRFEPDRSWAVGADFWFLKIRDVIGVLPEGVAFADPARYANSFVAIDSASGRALAYAAVNDNLGRQYASGIDFDVSGRALVAPGTLSSRLMLSYMLRDVSQLQPDGPYDSAIGSIEERQTATFRWIARWATSLQMGAWTHSVTVNARSGFLDREEIVVPVDGSGAVIGAAQPYRLKVERYATVDWQTDWQVGRGWLLTLGALNVFDRDPPLSIASAGSGRGQQAGFDDRYYDPRGRTVYVNASYKF